MNCAFFAKKGRRGAGPSTSLDRVVSNQGMSAKNTERYPVENTAPANQ
jgi:hypothetical protein